MAKKVTGIGNNPKAEGAHIHIVVKGGQALCDKRTAGLKLMRELSVHDVTCTKCMRYSYYKKAIEKPKPEPKAKPEPKKKAPVQKDTKAEESKAAPPEETPETEATQEAKPEIEADESVEFIDFVAVENGKGAYAIKHLPSDRTFFDVIPANIVAFALAALNAIKVRWEAGATMPKNFVQECRKVLTQVYKDRKVELPSHLAKPLKKTKKKKPPVPPEGIEKEGDEMKIDGVLHYWNGYRMVRKQRRVLKRRKPKPKRVLRRRKPKKNPPKLPPQKVNEIGMLMDKPPAFIYEYLKAGVHYGFLIDEMKHKFSMNDAQAKRKFKTVVRQLTRVNELTITHLIVANPNLHFYSIDNIAQKATQ